MKVNSVLKVKESEELAGKVKAELQSDKKVDESKLEEFIIAAFSVDTEGNRTYVLEKN